MVPKYLEDLSQQPATADEFVRISIPWLDQNWRDYVSKRNPPADVQETVRSVLEPKPEYPPDPCKPLVKARLDIPDEEYPPKCYTPPVVQRTQPINGTPVTPQENKPLRWAKAGYKLGFGGQITSNPLPDASDSSEEDTPPCPIIVTESQADAYRRLADEMH